MREIGVVKSVQIQQASLKRMDEGLQLYDPAPLLQVGQLRLAPQGIYGVLQSGEEIVDVHNALHPQSKNIGDNGVSVGFTGHYAAMRERFGDHMQDGIAGENILVEASGIVSRADLGESLVIQPADGSDTITLGAMRVAAPCEPFSRFALQQTPPVAAETMKATLQFLSAGIRGFYATAQGGMVQPGDRVFVKES